MSVHVSDRKRHSLRPGQQALVALLAVTALVAPAWSWLVISTSADVRQTVAAAVGAAGIALCSAVTVAAHQAGAARTAREHRIRADAAAESLENEAALLADRILPALTEGIGRGRTAHDVIAERPLLRHAVLHRLVQAVGTEIDATETRAARDRAHRAELEEQVADLGRDGLTLMLTRIREDRIGATDALARDLPDVHDVLAGLRRRFLHELLDAERRSASAMETAAAAGARIQAHLTTLLAKLRELQDRYGDTPGIFGDLLDVDHGVARTGRLADSFVVLAGGRSGRRWTRPIIMESILRGAMGRISAYRRIRLHNTSTAAIAGYAAEGVIQALTELMDNAANFSAHGTEVHVYVQEEDTGLTITVEDSGLGMRVRERRLAENLVTQPRDLATLRGTRMGLAVVGRLAEKYGLNVSFRPSARGGIGVVVLVPTHLVTEPQPLPERFGLARRTGPNIPGPVAAKGGPVMSRSGADLPQRRRGQTLAAALREEPHQLSHGRNLPPEPGSDPGARFAAFRNAHGGTEPNAQGDSADSPRPPAGPRARSGTGDAPPPPSGAW